MKFHSKSANNQGLGVSALARRWGVHPNTVRRYITDGNLRALRLGGKLHILAEDYQAYEQWTQTSPSNNGEIDSGPSRTSSSEKIEATLKSNITTPKASGNSFQRAVRMRKTLSPS